jgi:N-acetylglucosaminyl-diphospho-decaprenol L-rhamnosyltransferase
MFRRARVQIIGQPVTPPPDLLTVVIVTWNGAHLLDDCLDSLEAQTLPDDRFRVVVVDNASDDGTVALLARSRPTIEVIVSDRNTGFAGGADLGLRAVTTPYAVVLNNDAVADPRMLAAFVDALEAPDAERVAAVTGKVLLAESGHLNSTGNLMTRTGRGYDRDWKRPNDGSRVGGEVFGFCGAAAALRMSAVREVGGFDPDLFLYYEDTDLSWRLRAAGWTVRYAPEAAAHHRHAATSSVGSPLFTYWNERNSLVVFTRHAPATLVIRMFVRRTVGLAVHTARTGVTDAVTRARWRATASFARRLPLTLRERRSSWRSARCTRREVASLLTAVPEG